VLKPIVGAGARRAMRGGPSDVAEGDRLLRADPRGHLLQPFLDDVPTHGEISVILLEGEPSHAGRKVPKAGDWRAQAEYGGALSAEQLTPEIVDLARRVLAVVPGATTYARIDLVPYAGRLVVIEAEVVEPALYWNWAPEAADRFAAILKRRLAAR
jgi:glutathione synthase/RimK-type ligase-like ATP-grasp enzyme